MRIRYFAVSLSAAALVAALSPAMSAQAIPRPDSPAKDAAATAAYWTAERRAAAIPRDIIVDARGQSYLRGAAGLQPYGPASPELASRLTQVGDAAPQPMARPGGTNDTTGPTIEALTPTAGSVVGTSAAFSAKVTDSSGVRSVSIAVNRVGSVASSFTATKGANDVWSVSLQGFTDGDWEWRVTAKDNARKGGNGSAAGPVAFTVSTSGSDGGGGESVVVNSPWPGTATIQQTAGRIYFEMPSNVKQTRWSGYVCSGTVVNDGVAGRSIVVTAVHCVYDDANGAFARSVMFIPNQDQTSGAGTDRDCLNDPIGCWTASHGVVDRNWTTRSWPDNIPWDYAYYVVPDVGAHFGAATPSDVLDAAVGGGQSLPFASDLSPGSPVAALGYSYSDDPNFMYCSEGLSTTGAANWWLPSCGLSGGASGGPWLRTVAGDGAIFSVNSWGYSNQPGMAGPKLATSSAPCVYRAATTVTVDTAAIC